MKTTLTYQFDDDDIYAKNHIQRITHATGAYNALFNISEHIRSELKKDLFYSADECMDKMNDKFCEILEDNGISLDDLE